jgi:uncharacterized protein
LVSGVQCPARNATRQEITVLRSTTLASLFMLTALGGCATDDVDIDLEPACEDDTKCDGVSSEGFELFQGADGRYYFHLVSANGEIIMQSQGYTTKSSAVNGVESVRTNGVYETRYKLKQAANGEYYVNLTARNGAVIASTETYAKAFNAQRGMESTIALVSKAQRLRAAASGARFQSFIGADHQAYFQLRGANGEVMLASEGYVNAYGAVEGTKAVRTAGKTASNYKLLQAVDGQWYFHLQAANGEVVAHSETYADKSNAQRAITSLVALLGSELVADAKPATAPTKSVTQQAGLVSALDAFGDIAAAGEQLSYFGYAEQAQKPASATCATVSAQEAVNTFDQMADQVMSMGNVAQRPDLTAAQITSARGQFATLLGSDSYEICSVEMSGAQTDVMDTFVLSTRSGGPRLVFQLGMQQ